MKLHKLFFTILILFLAVQVSFGQEKPKAELIDELGLANCENFDAWMDRLLITLQNSKATGYVVIFGDKNHALYKYEQENKIESYAVQRGFSNGLIIVHGKDSDAFRMQFWQVPSGAEKPNVEEQKWDYSLPEKTKPFILYSEGVTDDICPQLNANELMAKLLLANPNINAHFAIYSNSAKKFQQTKNKLMNEFTQKHKISRSRLKMFYAKKTGDVDLEYWIVPKRKLG